MLRVLFVCTGNICRSPMAEAVFTHLVESAGLAGQIISDSAGTTGYHVGEAPHRGTQKVLRAHGIPYNGRARLLTGDDIGQFDYLIAMDNEHLRALHRRRGVNSTAKIARLLDYTTEVSAREVPDPYYSGAFEETYKLVLAGAHGLLAHIREAHRL